MILDSRKGYFSSHWPSEDGGPMRLQSVHGVSGLNIHKNSVITTKRRRIAFGSMVVLRKPGEVYLLSTDIIRGHFFKFPVSVNVKKIHPITLKTIQSSVRLPAGPFWPGGFAVHKNGDLYVIAGRWCHRLNEHCQLINSKKLPIKSPYNSFVILDNGYIITKQFNEKQNAHILVIDPDTLDIVQEIIAPEPSIARLSAIENCLYVVGTHCVFCYNWHPQKKLFLEPSWSFDYIGQTKQTFGWDPVITPENLWFIDNGKHRYLFTLKHAGVGKGMSRLVRISLKDPSDHSITTISGKKRGVVTNPPFYDPKRKIVVAYDSGNSIAKAFKFDEEKGNLQELWSKKNFGMSSHMIFYSDTGELCTNDYQLLKGGDHSVVLDITTGTEKSRIKLGNVFQGVIFPAPGWDRDYYYLTFDMLIRIAVQ